MSLLDPKYRSIESVARELGLPVAFVRREVEASHLPAIRCGRRWLVNAEEIESALRERTADRQAGVRDE